MIWNSVKRDCNSWWLLTYKNITCMGYLIDGYTKISQDISSSFSETIVSHSECYYSENCPSCMWYSVYLGDSS